MSPITVTAAVIQRQTDQTILLARRRPGKHLAGFWEFPGGKLEPGERPETALQRELHEEFGIDTEIVEFIVDSLWHYPEKSILLKAYRVKHLSGEFLPVDHDRIDWVPLDGLRQFKLAPADIPIVEHLLQSAPRKHPTEARKPA